MKRFSIPKTSLLPLIFALGCAGSAPPVVPPTPVAPATTMPHAASSAPLPPAFVPTADVDPVASAMTVDGVTALCDNHLARAQSLLETIKALKSSPDDKLTWDATFGAYDLIALELSVGGGFPGLMAVGHPDKAVRDAAKACEPKTDKFRTELMLDADFGAVVKRYAAKNESLDPVRARLVRETIRDLHRNGLDLPADKQNQLRALNEELTKLSQDFTSNISDAVSTLKIKPAQLKGLPPAFVAQHKPEADGLVSLTTNYPDYFPVVTYVEDRTVARDLTQLFDNRAQDKNLKLLDRVLLLREQKAKLLGYATWADYAIEPRMAKTPSAVKSFLEELAGKVKEPARKEYREFEAEYRKHGGKEPRVPNYERLYLEQKLREKKYGFDSKQLSEYFEMGSVTTGLLSIVQKLYGIELRDEPAAARWHPDVRVLDVLDQGKRIGRIYLDLHPREGKYKHAAMFEIRSGKQLNDGRYVEPEAALMCNFPKPGETPALMTHSDVSTYFHEFGHVLHHVLTRQPLANYAGTNTARDFVEAPSQLFEEWTYRRDTLDIFAKHYQSGEKIPDALFQSMTKSRSFGRALGTERQLSLATLDFAYHTSPLPFDTDKVFTEVMGKTQQFTYLPGTHFQATFGHLMGYDAGYYSYQWALAIARDLLTRFEHEGFMNESTARDWRKAVLEQGAGDDEAKLVERFLGRPTNLEAYSRYLREK